MAKVNIKRSQEKDLDIALRKLYRLAIRDQRNSVTGTGSTLNPFLGEDAAVEQIKRNNFKIKSFEKQNTR